MFKIKLSTAVQLCALTSYLTFRVTSKLIGLGITHGLKTETVEQMKQDLDELKKTKGLASL